MADIGDEVGFYARGFQGSFVGGFIAILVALTLGDIAHDGLHHDFAVQHHGVQRNLTGKHCAVALLAHPLEIAVAGFHRALDMSTGVLRRGCAVRLRGRA